jgi:S1-C subfamily serine protease
MSTSNQRGVTLLGAAIVIALALPNAVVQSISPKTTQAIVLVLCRTGQHPYEHDDRCGTAFHVGAGIFYTNAHVAKQAVSGMYLWDSVDNGFSPAEVVCVDSRWGGGSVKNPSFDIAMVKAPKFSNLPALRLTNRQVEPLSSPQSPRERVLIIGYPDRGNWAGFSDITQTAWYYKISGWIGVVTKQAMTIERDPFPQGITEFYHVGASGSTVLNESGEVIGIAYASGDGPTGPILAVPVPAATAVCH